MQLLPPIELRGGPFNVAQARLVGLTWKSLQQKQWMRMSHGQYAWARLRNDTMLRLCGVLARMPSGTTFSGPTAGWLHGLDMVSCDPIEVTIDRSVPVRARAGVRVRRAALPETDVVMRHGLPTTSALRTARDLGSRRDLTEAVAAIDMALHARLVDMASLASFVHMNPGTKGIRRLRRAIGLADAGAESPMETRLRLALVADKLPRPCSQAQLKDRSGRTIARVDLYYPDLRLVIEYDGENHKDRIASDLRRQNALINSGYHVLRFTAADLGVGGGAAARVREARQLLAKSVR